MADLKDYVKTNLKKGYSKQAIKDKLKKSGYSDSDIKKAMPKISIILIIIIIFIVSSVGVGINEPVREKVKEVIHEIASAGNPEAPGTRPLEPQKRKLDVTGCDEYCCNDSDCDDGNPETVNICSGTPKLCYDITYSECIDCFPMDFMMGGGGGGGNKGGNNNNKNPSPTGPECESDEDCLEHERCISENCQSYLCIDLGGRNCDWDQICDGDTIVSYDNPRCCLGECVYGYLDCEAFAPELAATGCDPGCYECSCDGEKVDREDDWTSKICLEFPEGGSHWMDYPLPVCPKGPLSGTCICGVYFCGYVPYENCVGAECIT